MKTRSEDPGDVPVATGPEGPVDVPVVTGPVGPWCSADAGTAGVLKLFSGLGGKPITVAFSKETRLGSYLFIRV